MRKTFLAAFVPFVFLGLSMTPSTAQPPESGAAPPPARMIPGITAEDMFPNGCVGCHVSMPELDARLSTAMQQWTEAADPKLVAMAQGAMPPGVALSGRHPEAAEALESIPGACMECHAPGSAAAPDFGRMIHAIHLTGGDENHFMTLFQGECTHCHKLDPGTGIWTVPDGREP